MLRFSCVTRQRYRQQAARRHEKPNTWLVSKSSIATVTRTTLAGRQLPTQLRYGMLLHSTARNGFDSSGSAHPCRKIPCAERIVPALKEACGGELPAWLSIKGKVVVPDLNPDNVGSYAEEGARILCHHSITGKEGGTYCCHLLW